MEDNNEDLKELIDKLNAIKNVSENLEKKLQEYMKNNEVNETTANGLNSDNITALFDNLYGEVSVIRTKYTEILPKLTKTVVEYDNNETELVSQIKLEENEENEKKYIKLVDFNKLVDPKNLELMNNTTRNDNNTTNDKESSIIVLSSSDDEQLPKNNSAKKTVVEKDNNQTESVSQIKLEEIEENNSTKKTSTTTLKYPPKSVLKVFKISKKDGSYKCVNSKNDAVEKLKKNYENDVKLKSKPYVKLLRVNCEDMKQFYSDKLQREAKEKNTLLDEATGELVEKRKSPKPRSRQLKDQQRNSERKALKKESQKLSSVQEKPQSPESEQSREETESEGNLELDKTSNSNEEVEKNEPSETEKCETSEASTKSPVRDQESKENDVIASKNESNKDKPNSSSDSDDSIDFSKRKKGKKFKKKASDSEDETQKDKSDVSDANNSGIGASDAESDTKKKSPTKKSRIRNRNDDSSDDDNLKTRKKLKVISKNKLSNLTKKAASDERERRQRILEKQKKYNQIYEDFELAKSELDKLVLDYDEKSGEPILEVNKKLISKLKPHQATGIQFMWDACFESVEKVKEGAVGGGCILAHCMGLGKTLQVITLVDTLLESFDKTKTRKVLIVTPLTTVLNWKSEFSNWLTGDEDYEIYELASCKSSNSERSMYMKSWDECGGVMIMSYSMFRNFGNENNTKIKKNFRKIFLSALIDPGPDLVVCDEGHLLKNEKSSLSMVMNKIKTQRRIVLTGTPLQNNMKEYYCMVQFVKPNLLGTYKEYLNRFVNPITNGQYTDSTQYDIDLMRRRSHVLHKLLEGVVQRKDYSVLSAYLPPKYEYVLFLSLTETQKKLYRHYLDVFARKSRSGFANSSTSYLFQDYQAFVRICIHPRVLLDKSINDQKKIKDDDEDSEGSLKDFIASSTDSSTGSGSDSDQNTKEKQFSTRSQRAARKKIGIESDEDVDDENQKEWWQEFCDGDELDNIAHSTKILLLFEILKECEEIGDKVLVFSQSLYALNLIEYFLTKVDEATQNGDANEKTCGYTGSWVPGIDYFRLDGSTNCNLRSNWCDNFNKEQNSRARLFLLSTKAGGLGINLVAANRVIIFDVSWNPSSDIQSIYRVYRFGQLKPSYVYRFVMYGTMEMKIYERQVTKQAISKRVIDEQQIDRHYNQNDLAELYKFDVPSQEERPIPMVPKDVLLGELLQNHDDKIFKYHEHQSLLENRESETLNEAEMKAAWDEFENERVERTKQVSLIGKFTLTTIHAALKKIIQRDNPEWNNSQILSIIPQLIQKLESDLIKGDYNMYNKIAQEIHVMQEEYAKKMQMQFQQYQSKMNEAMVRQLYQMNLMKSGQFSYPSSNNTPIPGTSSMNSNDVIELN